MLNITHLLNAAEGKKEEDGCVNTGSTYYADTAIKYLGLPIADLSSTCIAKYFDIAANFIDEAVSTGGKLLYIYSFLIFDYLLCIFRFVFKNLCIFFRKCFCALQSWYISECYMYPCIFNDKKTYVSN
jgi:hypothetical protein